MLPIVRDAGQLAGLVDGLRQRLLRIDVDARLHRPHGDRRVHVVGRRDVDRIEAAFLVEQFAPVLVDAGIGEVLAHLAGPAPIDLGDGDEAQMPAVRLAAAELGQRLDIAPGHTVGAEAGVQHGVVGPGRGAVAEHERGSAGRQHGLQGTAAADAGGSGHVRVPRETDGGIVPATIATGTCAGNGSFFPPHGPVAGTNEAEELLASEDGLMASTANTALLRHIRKLASAPDADRNLLQRDIDTRDEAAFAALVERHGPVVRSVCRSVLRHEQDAEDAFQATFLVLARTRAASASSNPSAAGCTASRIAWR